MTKDKGRDRSHLRLVASSDAPASETPASPAGDQPAPSYQAWDPNRTPPSSKLVELVRSMIKDGIVRVNTGISSEERFKFVCSKTGNFAWIMVSRIDANRIIVRSNDEQMDIGKPPSFYRTGKREEANDFIINVMAYLCQFIGNYQNIKIVHEVDPIT